MPTRFHLALGLIALLVLPVAIIVFNWPGEDCYISCRFAENLAEGHGLVFNATDETRADRVEGFSNLSFTLLLAAVHRLGGSTPIAARWIAALAAAFAVVALGLLAVAVAPAGRRRAAALLPAALFALQPVIQYQIGRALESTLVALLLTVAALLFVRRRLLATSLMLGLVALTRPEGFLILAPFVAAWALEWWLERRNADAPRARDLIFLIAPFAIITATLFLWRFAYYGHWLPNSAIAKAHGAVGSSLPLIGAFIVSWTLLPLLVPFAALGLRRALPARRCGLVIALLLIAHQLAFILVAGNVAASAHRHFVPLIPFACLLIAEVILLASARLPHRATRVALVTVCLLLSLWTVNNGDGRRTRLHVRLVEFVRSPDGPLNNPLRQFAFHWRWFHSSPIRLDTRSGQWMREHLPADALIAADQMGQQAYHARQSMIDMLGIVDETIGRGGLNPDYVLGRDPDFVILVWFHWPEEEYPAFQRLMFDHPEFQARYRLRWIHTQDLSPHSTGYDFHLFVRADHDDGAPLETVVLPGSAAECERWWRATE